MRTRAHVRLRRWRLDRDLAERHDANHSELHALRARQLATRRTRLELARSLRDVVAKAHRPHSVLFDASVPVLGASVRTCESALLELAERLERPGPLNPRGLARVMVLLTDPGGPLYSEMPTRGLGDALWWIADGLQLRGAGAEEPAEPGQAPVRRSEPF